MSHDILFGRQFIKTAPDRYIAMLLIGDSSLTEGSGRRERYVRSWTNIGECDVTARDMLDDIRWKYTPGDNEVMMRNGKWIYARDMVSLFTAGIKYAKTLEEISALCPAVSLNAEVIITDRETGHHEMQLRQSGLRTTPDLVSWLDEAKALRREHTNEYTDAGLHLRFTPNEAMNIERFVSGALSSDGAVIAKIKGHGKAYLSEYSSTSITTSSDIRKAMVFENAAAAYAVLPRSWQYTFIKQENQTLAMQKHIVLKVTEGLYTGKYISRLTRSKLHLSPSPADAKLFSSTSEANRWFSEKIGSRFKTHVDQCKALDINEIS